MFAPLAHHAKSFVDVAWSAPGGRPDTHSCLPMRSAVAPCPSPPPAAPLSPLAPNTMMGPTPPVPVSVSPPTAAAAGFSLRQARTSSAPMMLCPDAQLLGALPGCDSGGPFPGATGVASAGGSDGQLVLLRHDQLALDEASPGLRPAPSSAPAGNAVAGDQPQSPRMAEEPPAVVTNGPWSQRHSMPTLTSDDAPPAPAPLSGASARRLTVDVPASVAGGAAVVLPAPAVDAQVLYRVVSSNSGGGPPSGSYTSNGSGAGGSSVLGTWHSGAVSPGPESLSRTVSMPVVFAGSSPVPHSRIPGAHAGACAAMPAPTASAGNRAMVSMASSAPLGGMAAPTRGSNGAPASAASLMPPPPPPPPPSLQQQQQQQQQQDVQMLGMTPRQTASGGGAQLQATAPGAPQQQQPHESGPPAPTLEAQASCTPGGAMDYLTSLRPPADACAALDLAGPGAALMLGEQASTMVPSVPSLDLAAAGFEEQAEPGAGHVAASSSPSTSGATAAAGAGVLALVGGGVPRTASQGSHSQHSVHSHSHPHLGAAADSLQQQQAAAAAGEVSSGPRPDFPQSHSQQQLSPLPGVYEHGAHTGATHVLYPDDEDEEITDVSGTSPDQDESSVQDYDEAEAEVEVNLGDLINHEQLGDGDDGDHDEDEDGIGSETDEDDELEEDEAGSLPSSSHQHSLAAVGASMYYDAWQLRTSCINCTRSFYGASCCYCGQPAGEGVVDAASGTTAQVLHLLQHDQPAAAAAAAAAAASHGRQAQAHEAAQAGPAHRLGSGGGPVLLSYDDRALLHMEESVPGHSSDLGRSHPERPERVAAVMDRLHATGLAARCMRLWGREASLDELSAVHDPELIRAVDAAARAADRPGRHSQMHQEEDDDLEQFLGGSRRSRHVLDCYFNRSTAQCARLAAGSAADVAVRVAAGVAPVGAAIVRPPGHHAESSVAMGFCYFNNAAVAARAAQAQGGARRVLIMDWDVHHGNGTQNIFYEDASVLYISTHRYDYGSFYPGSGGASEVGSGAGEGYTVNVPWNRGGVSDCDMLTAFHFLVVPIAAEFKPDLVIVSAGFDAVKGDPLGGCAISPQAYGHFTAMLAQLGPLVLLLEGGYNLSATAAATECCMRVLLGEQPPTLDPQSYIGEVSEAAAESIAASLRVQSQYWTSAKHSMGAFAAAMAARAQLRAAHEALHAAQEAHHHAVWGAGAAASAAAAAAGSYGAVYGSIPDPRMVGSGADAHADEDEADPDGRIAGGSPDALRLALAGSGVSGGISGLSGLGMGMDLSEDGQGVGGYGDGGPGRVMSCEDVMMLDVAPSSAGTSWAATVTQPPPPPHEQLGH